MMLDYKQGDELLRLETRHNEATMYNDGKVEWVYLYDGVNILDQDEGVDVTEDECVACIHNNYDKYYESFVEGANYLGDVRFELETVEGKNVIVELVLKRDITDKTSHGRHA